MERLDDWKPPPQVALQVVHANHADTEQLIGQSWVLHSMDSEASIIDLDCAQIREEREKIPLR